jgi:hypothetical protein
VAIAVLEGATASGPRTIVGIKREIVTSAYYNDIALLLHALGCLNLNKHSLAGSRVTRKP